MNLATILIFEDIGIHSAYLSSVCVVPFVSTRAAALAATLRSKGKKDCFTVIMH